MRTETKMGLVAVSLMLLVGAHAQHGAVIDSETDLLAQASDQLINVDHELEAIETIAKPSSQLRFSSTSQLPFGARIPIYKNTQFAYGYTIHDTSQLPVAQQNTNIAHINIPNQRTETLHHTKSKTTNPLSSQTSFLKTNTDTLTSASGHIINKDESLLPIAPISRTSINMPIPDVPLNIQLQPPRNEFLQSASQIRALPPSPPPDFLTETKGKESSPVDGSYLPPVLDFKTETPQILTPPANDYLPPVKNHTDASSKPPITENTSIPTVDGNSEPYTVPSLPLNGYIPPLEEKTEPESDPPQPVIEYIPPVENKTEVESDPPKPVTDYIPPEKDQAEPESDPPQPINEYIPPVNENIFIESDPPQPVTDYIPPVKVESSSTQSPPSHQYLPPLEDKSITPEPPISIFTPKPPPATPPNIITPNPPIGIKTEPKDNHIISGSKNDVQHPLRPIGFRGSPKPRPATLPNIVAPNPPIGIKTEPKDHHIISGSINDDHQPLPPIGFRVTPKPPPTNHPNFETISPPIGIKINNNDHHIISGSKKNNQQPLSPIGFRGENQESPITTQYENPRVSPIGIVGIAEETRIVPGKVESNYKPLPPISEPSNYYVTPLKGEQSILSPIGIVGTQIDDAVITPVKFEKHPPSLSIVAGNEISLQPFPPTSLVQNSNDYESKPITANPPAPPPFGVLAEYENNHIQPQKGAGPILLPAIPQKNNGCSVNSECSDSQICMDGMCVNACVIAVGLCVGNAVCKTQRHIPGCVCPSMFTAITIRNYGQQKYDCRPMMMMTNQGSSNTASFNEITAGRSPNIHQFTRPISDFRNHHGGTRLPTLSVLSSQGRISSSQGFRNTGQTSSDPCRPTPCGPNTSCSTTRNGIAQCRCLDDFVPDGNTITGCKPQCESENDCPDDYRCQSTKCVRVCQPGACGSNADCEGRNHRAICECPNGYEGRAESRCTKIQILHTEPKFVEIDPCDPNPCGQNAECRTRGERAVCTCPIGYEGDPLTNCRRGECIEANDCPGHQTCQKLRCINPCNIPDICGRDAECQTRNHQPICSCGLRMVGDPFVQCRQFRPEELCEPSPCGRSTNCKLNRNRDRAVCSCIDNYLGDPLKGCHPECVSDSECRSQSMACERNRCVNPCVNACGENALCDVVQGRARCSCPQYYQGNPQSRCSYECATHDACPSYQACFQLQCVDPCDGACGVGAECKVEDHKPICFCPKGYTGHPFESCRPFTPADLCEPNPCGQQADCTPGFDRDGNDRPVCTCPRGFIGNPIVSCQRGECERHSDCRDSQACYAYTCQNPCYTDLGSVCGDNAQCAVKNNQPVCSCPPGYDGNPLQSCSPRRG